MWKRPPYVENSFLKFEIIILQISHLNFGKLSFSTVQIFAKILPLKKIRKSLHFSQILMHNFAIALWGKVWFRSTQYHFHFLFSSFTEIIKSRKISIWAASTFHGAIVWLRPNIAAQNRGSIHFSVSLVLQ